jgi:hypothetical protein
VTPRSELAVIRLPLVDAATMPLSSRCCVVEANVVPSRCHGSHCCTVEADTVMCHRRADTSRDEAQLHWARWCRDAASTIAAEGTACYMSGRHGRLQRLRCGCAMQAVEQWRPGASSRASSPVTGLALPPLMEERRTRENTDSPDK